MKRKQRRQLRRRITISMTEEQWDIIGDALAIASDARADKRWWKKNGILSTYKPEDYGIGATVIRTATEATA